MEDRFICQMFKILQLRGDLERVYKLRIVYKTTRGSTKTVTGIDGGKERKTCFIWNDTIGSDVGLESTMCD